MSDHEILSTRTFAAPPEAVYGAFADPARLAQWWGPSGFTNTVGPFELRAGGAFHIVMRGPDGAEYDNHSRFVEVHAGRRVVFDHLEPVHTFRMTMLFEPAGGGTKLTWHMRFTKALAPATRAFLIGANEQNFDRLQAHLAAAAR